MLSRRGEHRIFLCGIYWERNHFGKKVKGVNQSNPKTVLAVGSVTNAMRGKTLLNQNGISATVGRARPDERTGCGYTLTVTGEAERARHLLSAAGIRVRPAP